MRWRRPSSARNEGRGGNSLLLPLPVSDRLDALGPLAAELVKQLLKAILAQPQDLSAEFVAAGPVAWVAAEGAGQGKVGGQAIEFPLRATVVLE
jgi:hypothetical protein